MDFRIANTFTDSLAKLSGDEQKATKTAVFDLQTNPSNPGLKFHKLDRAKDKNFWSVRAGRDIRIIVHRTDRSLMACYVDHHDKAYDWANRRRIEQHSRTGAAQIVEIRETVREIQIPKYVEAEQPAPETPPAPQVFVDVSPDKLLGFGVPEEWLDDVLVATEDSLLEIAEHLPQEAAERLLVLATGGTPEPPVELPTKVDPFQHPDAERRFRTMDNLDELRAALDSPWEKWITFLHPSQREVATRAFNGPARVCGSAGTGKTVVALHRAVHLAKAHDADVLLTTFSRTLAKALRVKLKRLLGEGNALLDRITVRSLDETALDAYEDAFGQPHTPTASMLRAVIKTASEAVGDHKFTLRFLETEWNDVVDAWQLDTWEAYRDVPRLGRKTRLGEKQRGTLWKIFSLVRDDLANRGITTMPTIFESLTKHVESGGEPPARFIVVDEAQDVSVPQLRFLAAAAGDATGGLFFAGDLGQRIFQTPFSWKTLGVDIRGRSKTLRICYRTTHQIRQQADMLLPTELRDVDGNEESRAGTISVFNGDRPMIIKAATQTEEVEIAATWLREQLDSGIQPEEIGVFVRSNDEIPRAQSVVSTAGAKSHLLHANDLSADGKVSIGTMHLAKGLEFRSVAVVACDEDIIPSMSRIEAAADQSELEDVHNTERHLLYVACTRARDHLLVSCVEPGSEFLDDMNLLSHSSIGKFCCQGPGQFASEWSVTDKDGNPVDIPDGK